MPVVDDIASPLPPLVLRSAAGRWCRIERPVFLAPMDGVTDVGFRRLVVSFGGLGAVCTPFARVSVAPLKQRQATTLLGDPIPGVANGVQLMAADDRHLGRSAAAVARTGADFIDLNFGCPARRVTGHGAGAALLDDPALMAAMVAAVVAAQDRPVTVKLRPGRRDARGLEGLLDAVCAAGASLVTVHARLGTQGYGEPPDWSLLRRARAHMSASWPGLPLIANGGIDGPEAARAVLAESGADGLMVGQAALVDPWIFRRLAGGKPVDADEAQTFLRAFSAQQGADLPPVAVLGRLKQLVARWRCDALPALAQHRRALLRCRTPEHLLDLLCGEAGPSCACSDERQ